MSLERYRQKRDFLITPEPAGDAGDKPGRKPASASSGKLGFVVQQHAASHLHYDFRLELNGVLLSWAVPKGPSLDPNDKRLAMHVEDHPIEYGDFEGVIPAKQYGGGTVMLWDRGTWVPKGDPTETYAKGRLKFELHGEKLKGSWNLVRSRSGKYGGEKSWLLIKEEDDEARLGPEALIVEDKPSSVASGRSLEQIAAEADRVWHSNRSTDENAPRGEVATAKPDLKPASVAGARRSALPDIVEAQLATLVKDPPTEPGWVHEVKYDGYRMLCRIDNGKARMMSRNGKEWTAQFPEVVRSLARLPVKTAWIDGEVVVVDEQGRTSFQALQNVLNAESGGSLNYFAFDLLYLDGYDLRGASLVERKRVLQQLLARPPANIRYSDHFVAPGVEFRAKACKLGLEGMISKRADLPYQAGRGGAWLKIKCLRRQEMVIGGYTDPAGSRHGFGALLLGVYDEQGRLAYSGKVGTGFNDERLTRISKMLAGLQQKESPFYNPPTGAEGRRAHWVKPTLVAEVEFTEWTDDETLRHPSFKELREDKDARDVVREHEVALGQSSDERAPGGSSAPGRETAKRPRTARSAAETMRDDQTARGVKHARRGVKHAHANHETARPEETPRKEPPGSTKPQRPSAAGAGSSKDTVAGVALSNPDKLLFPEDGFRKRDLALYYEAVGEWVVPQVRDRPLTLVRCPNGWNAGCFYQKNAEGSMIDAIERVRVETSDGPAMYMMANSVEAVVALLQMGTLEMHPWGSSSPKLALPDRIIFDLDPDDGVEWQSLVQAVHLVRTLLENIGLACFLKTTGGKGLHVVVPITPSLGWNDVKGFTKAVAELLERTFPDRFTSKLLKTSRRGKIFIDYLRNGEGATAVAAYSLRAKAGAPVATPIAWEELKKDVRYAYFNVTNVPRRLAKLKSDPWKDMEATHQSLGKAMMAKVGYAPSR